MAILGGAGNPVGGSFTGPAEALEIIGDHAYGYSGIITSSGSEETLLSFTSGNFYTVAQWVPVYATDSGTNANYKVKMNGISIWEVNSTGSTTAAFGNSGNELIIPPYTEMEFTVTVGAEIDIGVVLTGRIYRTRD